MTIAQIFARYQAGGYSLAAEGVSQRADEQLYLALLAFGAGDLAAAQHHAAIATQHVPSQLVYAAIAEYLAGLATMARSSVYVEPGAFAAFVRGGGNVGLYEATSAALREAYTQDGARRVLDIGVGDGLALLPALTETIRQIDLVEPSHALLAATAQQLAARGIAHRAFNSTLQEFIARDNNDEGWDIIQATFSLQSIVPDEREPLLRWLGERGQRVLIAEFDVPAFADQFAPERVAYVVERFTQGLAEYADDGGLVAQGFLIPVLLGYFDRSAARTNYEQPIAEWAEQLRMAGFTSITTRQLYPYWWAPACLLDARFA